MNNSYGPWGCISNRPEHVQLDDRYHSLLRHNVQHLDPISYRLYTRQILVMKDLVDH